MLQEAHESQIPVEGKVQATCKGGFDVRLLQKRAFCPISQIDLVYVEDPDPYVGQTFSFVIKRFEERGLPAFEYLKQGKPYRMSYHLAPEEIYDDPEIAADWARGAFAAALRAKKRLCHR